MRRSERDDPHARPGTDLPARRVEGRDSVSIADDVAVDDLRRQCVGIPIKFAAEFSSEVPTHIDAASRLVSSEVSTDRIMLAPRRFVELLDMLLVRDFGENARISRSLCCLRWSSKL